MLNKTDKYISVYFNDLYKENWSLEEIVDLANEYRPENYSELTYKDIEINLGIREFSIFDVEESAITLEIKIKNKDYKKK